ncbi:MAG: ABC transporter ATP-binding protein [Lautropia sp.]|nr:ABC transporter ATP-binding protein [Lautropia sp.]
MTTTPAIALQASDISWHARRTPIVERVSASIREGEKIGLIGPNGSGKSTLLRLLAGLLRPSQGSVHLQGQPLQQLGRRDIARRIGMVAQMAEPLDAICARDAVELGRTPWLSALQSWSEHDDHIVDEALAAVSMQHKADSLWHQLSGGERQRIHIARALAQQPEILILDEPANHLDIRQQLALSRLLHQLPLTIVMAIHDLNQAQHCDRLLVMQDGRLVADGPPAEVLQPERIRQVFQVETRILTDPADGTRVLHFA